MIDTSKISKSNITEKRSINTATHITSSETSIAKSKVSVPY